MQNPTTRYHDCSDPTPILLSDKLSTVTHHHLLTRDSIFTTPSKTLQARLVVEHPRSAKEAWDLITDIFKDNKRSRTIALKAELRSIKIGDLSIDAYFMKIELVAIILTSL
ncbi:hypothetical protein Tco_1199484 [Tanacetum coccineum]